MNINIILIKLKFLLNLCENGNLPSEAGKWLKSAIEVVKQIKFDMDKMKLDGMDVPNEGQAITLKNIDADVMKWLGPDELDKLFELVILFDDYFGNTENLLHYDWNHTKNMLAPPHVGKFISLSGTFLYPEVIDEHNDWGSRGCFLDSYKKLRKEWVS